jgi:uncharacterized protein YggE
MLAAWFAPRLRTAKAQRIINLIVGAVMWLLPRNWQKRAWPICRRYSTKSGLMDKPTVSAKLLPGVPFCYGRNKQHGGATVKFKVMALAALVGLSVMSVQASELPDGPHIITSGTSSVDAVPDIATLAIEVNIQAKDAATAKKQADDRVAEYLSFLDKNGVVKKDINAANLRTQPDYDYQNGKSVLKGWRAVRTVEVTLRDLEKLNSLLDGALKAGLNEIRSVSLGVAQPDSYKDKARKAAIDDAVHQAEQLAAGFHAKLGPVYSVRYHVSNYQPSPMVRMMKADAAPVSAQETYEQPTIQFADQVDVVFQLEPTQSQTQQPATTDKTQ